jgi:hypothetical protein
VAGQEKDGKDKELSRCYYAYRTELPAESVVGEMERATTAWYRTKCQAAPGEIPAGIVASANPVFSQLE